MRRLLIAAAAALSVTSPATAETAAEKQAALAQVIEASSREYVVFLNCTATDADSHALMRKNWEEMVARSVALMTTHKVDADFVRQFQERTAYDKMILRSTPFGEIIALCQGDWMKRMLEIRFIMLHNRVSDILNR